MSQIQRPACPVFVPIVGAPSSGKTGPREGLRSYFGAATLASSQLILQAVSAGVFTKSFDPETRSREIRDLFLEVQTKMDTGVLIPDTITIPSFDFGFKSVIRDICRSNMLVSDGIPRTFDQVQAIRPIIGRFDFVIIPVFVWTPEDICFKRRLKRLEELKRKDDMSETTFMGRMQIFKDSFGNFGNSSPCLATALTEFSSLTSLHASKPYFSHGVVLVDGTLKEEDVPKQTVERVTEAIGLIESHAETVKPRKYVRLLD